MSLPALPAPVQKPHWIWWIAHIFFGIVTGLIVYVLWKDKNPSAAKSHLINSIWLPFAIYIIIFAIAVGIIGITSIIPA